MQSKGDILKGKDLCSMCMWLGYAWTDPFHFIRRGTNEFVTCYHDLRHVVYISLATSGHLLLSRQSRVWTIHKTRTKICNANFSDIEVTAISLLFFLNNFSKTIFVTKHQFRCRNNLEIYDTRPGFQHVDNMAKARAKSLPENTSLSVDQQGEFNKKVKEIKKKVSRNVSHVNSWHQRPNAATVVKGRTRSELSLNICEQDPTAGQHSDSDSTHIWTNKHWTWHLAWI